VAGPVAKLRPALQLEAVRAWRQGKRHLSRKHEVVSPKRQPDALEEPCGIDRPPCHVLEVHAACHRLASLGIYRLDGEFAGPSRVRVLHQQW
jgi:hypothetical protein